MTLLELTADKLEREPGLLRIPLENMDRWIAQEPSAPHRLEQWRVLIHRAQASPEGLRQLLGILRDRGETTEGLREFSPFAGVLTAAERAPSIRQCIYSHSII